MTKDLNKSIALILYNHLNLPIWMSGGTGSEEGVMSYVYDATGVKLSKSVLNAQTTVTTTTYYAGNYVYDDASGSNKLKFFNHAEGYVDASGGQFEYIYQYKDHLGNIRLSYKDVNQNNANPVSLQIQEENNYYPFGLKHKGYNGNINGVDHKYGFGSKEEQDELGLKWLDFSARNYDAALGRWMNIDQMSEMFYDWTPYKYSLNNPILLSDQDGNCEFCKKLLSSAWNAYKTTISNSFEGAKKLVTSPVESTKKAAINHIKQLKSPKGLVNLTKSILKQVAPISEEMIDVTNAALSDDFASTYGAIKGEKLADLTIEGAGLLVGEILGKGASLLKGLGKVDDGLIIVGQNMNRVNAAADALAENGAKGIEVFTPSKAALKEWNSLKSGGNRLSDKAIKGTKLFKENAKWINNAKESGKTILDIGSDGSGKASPFYDMEKRVIYNYQ